jgi:hypothetical protein
MTSAKDSLNSRAGGTCVGTAIPPLLGSGATGTGPLYSEYKPATAAIVTSPNQSTTHTSLFQVQCPLPSSRAVILLKALVTAVFVAGALPIAIYTKINSLYYLRAHLVIRSSAIYSASPPLEHARLSNRGGLAMVSQSPLLLSQVSPNKIQIRFHRPESQPKPISSLSMLLLVPQAITVSSTYIVRHEQLGDFRK